MNKFYRIFIIYLNSVARVNRLSHCALFVPSKLNCRDLPTATSARDHEVKLSDSFAKSSVRPIERPKFPAGDRPKIREAFNPFSLTE